MSTLVVTDLDRTLVYSRAAFDLTVPDAAAPNLVTAEFYQGAPQSYLTLTAAALLQGLPAGVLVPATTRTIEQYLRVRLPIDRPRHAITSNGGNILIDDVPDPQWRDGITAGVAESAPLSEIEQHFSPLAGHDWVRTVRTADSLFCYLVAHTTSLPDGFADELRAWSGARGWRVSVQGRKVYALPEPLTKSTAVRRICEWTGADFLLGAGDGILDADVLEMADAAIRPRHGELHEAQWNRPHVAVTQSSGILAGEEMVRWYCDRLASENRR